MMIIFRVLLVVAWLAVVYVTVVAVNSAGIMASFDVFSEDLAAGNWHTQFDLDLLVHLILFGLWVAWRHKFSIGGIVLGLLCTFSGSLFSFVYLFILTLQYKGNVRIVLLGAQAQAESDKQPVTG